ncbi:unannotated protein [freshwater metagenome]|uniref:Unannotated protein n=1 Tax=freshwater metagenome TaxID=449393 RepID=A0A6J7E1G0_9ZZZZ
MGALEQVLAAQELHARTALSLAGAHLMLIDALPCGEVDARGAAAVEQRVELR